MHQFNQFDYLSQYKHSYVEILLLRVLILDITLRVLNKEILDLFMKSSWAYKNFWTPRKSETRETCAM